MLGLSQEDPKLRIKREPRKNREQNLSQSLNDRINSSLENRKKNGDVIITSIKYDIGLKAPKKEQEVNDDNSKTENLVNIIENKIRRVNAFKIEEIHDHTQEVLEKKLTSIKKEEKNFADFETKFNQINTKIKLLKEKIDSHSNFSNKVNKRIVQIYDSNYQILIIKEKYAQYLKLLETSLTKLLNRINQIFKLGHRTELNLLQRKIYHFRFYDNFGRILLKNIHFGKLKYVNDFDLEKMFDYYKFLKINNSSLKFKHSIKFFNLQNDI